MTKERFQKVYDKIPLKERDLPVVVIDDEEITWGKAFKEIEDDTELGKEIIEKLIEMEII